jgi:hypothetical protein
MRTGSPERFDMIAIKAHFDGKYLVPDEPLNLPCDKELRIQIEEVESVTLDSIYNLADLAKPTGIPDLSQNIDHYLYGHPKVKNGAE